MEQDGKTMMEIMLVVAIIGMLTGMAGPHFLPLQSRTELQCVAEEIASELRLARQLAITSRERVRVVFDQERRFLSAESMSQARPPRVYRYEAKSVEIAEPTAGPEILFHPSGRSATATTIEVRNHVGHVRKLTVSLTGRVSIL
jgi:type IV fimbrial biogenesis protein FimT